MARRWQQRSTTTAFENSRVRVLEDEVVLPDGSQGSYTVVEEETGAVVIVPVADDGRVLLVRQHRYPIDALTLEVPAGEVPPNIDPLDQARQELREETGVIASRVEHLGRFAAWPARVRRWSTVVLATGLDLRQLAANGQSGDESIEEVVLMSSTELRGMVAAGQLIDGPTLCAMNLFWNQVDLQQG